MAAEPTVESWARAYLSSTSLAIKVAPPSCPRRWNQAPVPERLAGPGRPPELARAERGMRTPKAEGFSDPRCRARVLHAFWHHELQAAELMCWALLAFAGAERGFRKGLLRICQDEIRHMALYQARIEALGFSIGDFPVRDWFWERVPACASQVQFVALMGMGFEAANLEHAPDFAARFRAVGDALGADVQERIAEEELPHVRFAVRWFQRWTGGCDFETWRAELPEPLSPMVLKGRRVDRAVRLRAGMPEDFIARLIAFEPRPPLATDRRRG